jgi:tRNA wybutosine-synthesizing protein 4
MADEFTRYFVHEPLRRGPLMNRGTFARVTAVRGLIRRFLAGDPLPGDGTEPAGCRRQVVSLGAGFDTAAFCMQAEGALEGAAYYELDFPDVVRQKARVIAVTPQLLFSLAGDQAPDAVDIDAEHGSVTASAGARRGRYCLRSADLRELDQVAETLEAAGLLSTLPTLLVAECVLIYMEPRHSDAIISWAAKTFSCAAFVNYEQICPNDNFGRMMVSNIASRGCPLKGIRACATHPIV